MKNTIFLIIVASAYFGFRKQLNYLFYSTIFKQKNMTNNSKYIVQYVGFKTNLNRNDFINRWTPFASNFKDAGIKTIDLYEVQNNENFAFISRNVWDEKTYFQNFPSGVAGSGSGGGISVTQFGGYWLAENQLERQDQMKLVFLNNIVDVMDTKITSRLSVTANVPYKQLLDLSLESNFTLSEQKVELACHHIKRM
jgi:hypothetical protein